MKNNKTDSKSFLQDLKEMIQKKELREAFLQKYGRQVLAFALLILFSVLMIVGGGKLKNADSQTTQANASGDAAGLTKSADEALNTMIQNYYDAYAEGNAEAVSEYATPVSENEAGYIALFGDYVESYTAEDIYVLPGVDDNAYLVSVVVSMKFNDIDTAAPGLDFFYVEKLADGGYYIDNVYSQFNYRTKEYVTEDQISDCISAYENRQDVIELQNQVDADYENAVASSEELEQCVNTDFQDAISDWMSTITLVQNQTPPETILTADADGDAEDTDDSESDEENTEETETLSTDVKVEEKAVTKSKCNMRKGANTTSDTVMTLKEGAEVTILGMNTWGEWSHVEVNGKKGYIRNDLIKTIDTEYSITGTNGLPSKGDKVALKETTNLLKRMKKKAGVISSITEGTKVKIIMIYQNGYSKVSCNGKIGYITTSSLDY